MRSVVTRRVRAGKAGSALCAPGLTVLLKGGNSRWALLAFVSLAASNCMLLSGRCLYELRNVYVTGSVVTSTIDSASAILVQSEQRDYQPDRDFSWQILGPDLKNHVQSIVLLETSTTSTPRYDFPLHPSTFQALSSGFVRESEGTDLRGMFDLLSSGKAIIRITTDLTDKTSVVIPLTRVKRDDWSRPYCS